MEQNKAPLWGGRFSEKPAELMIEFGSSINFDIELLEYDIMGSIVWAEALEKASILNNEEKNLLIEGLHNVKKELEGEILAGKKFDLTLEDVHMTVESRLIKLIGETGAKLHTGRSRNDQVALDEKLYILKNTDFLKQEIKSFQEIILSLAEKNTDEFVPSYTHLQQALPVRLGHYLMSWFWMLERDRERLSDLRKRLAKMPLGSGAVAGSGFEIDRFYIAERLGFDSPTENSIDAVSDRDHIIESVFCASVLMTHLSRISEDLIIWSTSEFGFIELPDNFTTGSSMMPQKKNPDSLELIRGKTGRVYGSLITILTVMKGLPLTYCRDMQEDKEPLFDAVKTVRMSLLVMKGALVNCKFKTERMKAAFSDNIYATDVADYLTRKGMPFRTAHETAGKLVKWSLEKNVRFSQIPAEVFKQHSELFSEDIYGIFDLGKSTDSRPVYGGASRKSLIEQIKNAKSKMEI
jgi:argininosuccinate lyase